MGADLALDADVGAVAGVTCECVAIAERNFETLEVPRVGETQGDDGPRQLEAAAGANDGGGKVEHGNRVEDRSWSTEQFGLAAAIAEGELLGLERVNDAVEVLRLVHLDGDAAEVIDRLMIRLRMRLHELLRRGGQFCRAL